MIAIQAILSRFRITCATCWMDENCSFLAAGIYNIEQTARKEESGLRAKIWSHSVSHKKYSPHHT